MRLFDLPTRNHNIIDCHYQMATESVFICLIMPINWDFWKSKKKHWIEKWIVSILFIVRHSSVWEQERLLQRGERTSWNEMDIAKAGWILDMHPAPCEIIYKFPFRMLFLHVSFHGNWRHRCTLYRSECIWRCFF